MINYATLPAKLRPWRVQDDTLLPWAYQRANPQGRPLHDDWLLFKSTPRINTAFMVPLPMKLVAGNATPEWVPVVRPRGWTFAPGAQTKQALYDWMDPQTGVAHHEVVTWVLTMTAVHPAGQWSRQAAWLGEAHGWTECYYSRSCMVFGKRFLWYDGLKIDANPTDFMVWFPELSGSWKVAA